MYLLKGSLIAQLVKNLPVMQETPVQFLVGKIPSRRDRLPTPVVLGFTCGSAGKESACNVGGLGLSPGLGRTPGEGKGYSLQYSGLLTREFHGPYSSWGGRESDTTEQLYLFTSTWVSPAVYWSVVQRSLVSYFVKFFIYMQICNFFSIICLFIFWLHWVLVLACRIFCCGVWA